MSETIEEPESAQADVLRDRIAIANRRVSDALAARGTAELAMRRAEEEYRSAVFEQQAAIHAWCTENLSRGRERVRKRRPSKADPR